jgi:hypothetical protein
MMSVGIIENIPLRQGGTKLDGHQNHSNKARRSRREAGETAQLSNINWCEMRRKYEKISLSGHRYSK